MTPASDPAATALDVLRLAEAGQFDAIHARLAPQLQPMISETVLRAAWRAALNQYGAVTTIGAPHLDPPRAGTITLRVPVSGERGAFTVLIVLTESHQLAGLQIAGASATQATDTWRPPEYADPAAFTERDLSLGDEPLPVGATLSLPRQQTRVPAVVMLAGSGPQDRDETLGPNKILKDVAWGLASLGIAVLRFDKVTLAHADALRANPQLTLTDEYVPHARAAIHALRREAGVDPDRIYVLGHSLGGTAAPRVAAAEPATAGLILVAAGAQPLHWSAVRQLRYLATLPTGRGGSAEAAEILCEHARRVDSADLSPSTPSTELPFGVPAPYWLDLRSYQPAQLVAALGKPILLVQGGRDYQVTVADDLQLWQRELGHRPAVTIRVFDADDHCLFRGTGPSRPADYETADHVDPSVITGIADWIRTQEQPHGDPQHDGGAETAHPSEKDST